MKTLITKLLFFAGAVFILQGCSINNDDNYCFNRAYMAATAVVGPATTQVNVEVEFMVTFPIVNSCGVFYDFAELNTTFPRRVAAAVDYTGCNCNETTTSVTKPYKFKASVPGTYILHFLTQNDGSPIIKTIEVTE
ncbi:hypothetical protein AM493_05180 [Flavobacterium akiainvivens]|uniref:GOLD domain-containing protein n=1 Tax=Flavobacterium akiainvivens TaxID=1202724 RepID=A0A0M8MG11_9FLAO|nr:hypothetical protein [Flavobacterium akiainvivens]KOS05491.1 hypothetical protein AM493_05180 [Flavobacterium akiainvivens]SFQ32996.1 hypothetical protein SAMN05444144_10371 [Flavobacterium akiainvivens]